MEFNLLKELQQEKTNQRKQFEQMGNRAKESKQELSRLEDEYKKAVASGKDVSELDNILDKIDTQKTLVNRRETELEMVKDVKKDSKYTGEFISQEFRKFTYEYRAEEVEPIVEKMEEAAQEYLDLQNQLEEKFSKHGTLQRQVQRALDERATNIIRSANNLTINKGARNLLKRDQINTFDAVGNGGFM